MANHSIIIRATRASASAVAAMARHNWELTHADRTIAWNNCMVARGYMSAESAARDNAVCIADKNRAMRGLARSRGRYERAQLKLARNPI